MALDIPLFRKNKIQKKYVISWSKDLENKLSSNIKTAATTASFMNSL